MKTRIPNWESVERGKLASKALALAYIPVAIFAANALIPPIGEPIGQLITVGIAALFGSIIGVRVLRKALPGPLSRFVFARGLMVYVSRDTVAFKSWYYDDGIRMDRVFTDGELAIHPSIADDPEAAEFKADLPRQKAGEPHQSRHHFDTSKQLQLVIRAGVANPLEGERDHQGGLRTIPVASMNNTTAENILALINAAMQLTAVSSPRTTARRAVGLDLDMVASEQGGSV